MAEERTIDPSPQRRRQLVRQRGIPKSPDVTTPLLLLIACAWLRGYLSELEPGHFRHWWSDWQQSISVVRVDAEQIDVRLLTTAGFVGGGLLLAIWLAALCGVAVQGGWTWRGAHFFSASHRASSPTAASPYWWTILVSLLKLLLFPSLLGWCLWHGHFWQMVLFIDSSAAAVPAFREMADGVLASMLLIAGSWILVGLLDYGVRMWMFRRSLRLTPAEWREELKRLEGRTPLRRLQR